MDQETVTFIDDYPVLLMPKTSTMLESDCEISDSVLIDLNITSPHTDGNEWRIYSGFCNIKIIDNCNLNFYHNDSIDSVSTDFIDNEQHSTVIADPSEVWIDPVRSPHVYNDFNSPETQNHYSMCDETHCSDEPIETQNAYVNEIIYNSEKYISYSPVSFEEQKTVIERNETTQHTIINHNCYEEEEFQCGVFLSHLPEEIINQKECKAREEHKYIGLQTENGALKQLMSVDIQSVSKQRKTILFLGHDSHCGQTIQKIAVNNSLLACSGGSKARESCDRFNYTSPRQKMYQCDQCNQIFDQLNQFKQHMVGKHSSRNKPFGNGKFICHKCGKTLKTQQKLNLHSAAHGNPELECNTCWKVFASKFTLRIHKKIHMRKYRCEHCPKSFSSSKELTSHCSKKHATLTCSICQYVSNSYNDYELHMKNHAEAFVSTKTDFTESFIDIISDSEVVTSTNTTKSVLENADNEDGEIIVRNDGNCDCNREKIRKADSDIAKVVSNTAFLLNSKHKKNKRYNKVCDICLKCFDRISDLKRHLIEHIVKSTLAKTPVSKNGTLFMQCDVCRVESFSKIDKYKAHLREHAKLTLYKCTFCDKSFSDSSNFSKHKKIHGTTYFQCDLCQRKFNSKKMITQHMEYHKNNAPLMCEICDKVFHFESMLNKHIKCAHTRNIAPKFKCRFCFEYFKSLKQKWDHEWLIHNVRKMIVDCLICESQFRKYSELKRHCINIHNMDIPPAKKLLKKE